MTGALNHSELAGAQLHRPFHYEQPTDPGAVGAFTWWFETDTGIIRRRNAGDTGWDVIFDPATLGVTDHGMLSGLGDDDHPQYTTLVEVNAHVNTRVPKEPCICATDTPIDLASCPPVVDGVGLSAGLRILAWQQADATTNGIYLCNGVGAALARADDADTGAKLGGCLVPVTNGATYGDTLWQCRADKTFVLGADPFNFKRVDPGEHAADTDPHAQYQKESEKGAANGYASLGADGLVPQDQLGSGTQDGTKFLRDDGSWQPVPAGGASALDDLTDVVVAAPADGQVLMHDGTDWDNVPLYHAINFVIGSGLAVITTGVKGDFQVPFDCHIESWTLLGDQSGSIVIDLWKDSYANFAPTVADTITASAKPTLASALKNTDATLAGWTRTVAAGDIMRVNVDSAAIVQRVTLSLKVRRLR